MDIHNISDDSSAKIIEETKEIFDEASKISSVSANSIRFRIRMLIAMLPSSMSSDETVQHDIPIPREISVKIRTTTTPYQDTTGSVCSCTSSSSMEALLQYTKKYNGSGNGNGNGSTEYDDRIIRRTDAFDDDSIRCDEEGTTVGSMIGRHVDRLNVPHYYSSWGRPPPICISFVDSNSSCVYWKPLTNHPMAPKHSNYSSKSAPVKKRWMNRFRRSPMKRIGT